MTQVLLMMLYIAALGGAWWFFGRKNRERAREMQEKMNAMKVGDHVVTIGGLHGIVNEIDNDAQTIELDCEGVFLTFERRAIHHVVPSAANSEVASTEETDSVDTTESTEE